MTPLLLGSRPVSRSVNLLRMPQACIGALKLAFALFRDSEEGLDLRQSCWRAKIHAARELS
jgi:hypothetical protein